MVEIRPKTSQLLAFFLNNPEEILSKERILQEIWQTQHISDQSLFQLISEIRQILGDRQVIKTYPNKGYQWTVSLNDSAPHKAWYRLRLNAKSITGFAVGIAASVYLMWNYVSVNPSVEMRVSLERVPALQALNRGFSKLEEGDGILAERWFVRALEENPQLHEARVMRAESLLIQGKADEARSVLTDLLAIEGINEYVRLSGFELLGRISVEYGDIVSALNLTMNAASQAEALGAQCTSYALGERLRELISTQESLNNPAVSVVELVQARELANRISINYEQAPLSCSSIDLPDESAYHARYYSRYIAKAISPFELGV